MDPAILKAFALSRMDDFGLLAAGWSFRFDRARRRFGICRFGVKEISVSRTLVELNPEEECRDTVLHEIAHALAGPRAGHGPKWKAMCRRVGARANRCYNHDQVAEPQHRYEARCATCGHSIGFHRRPSRERACAKCCRRYAAGKFDRRFMMRLVEVETGQAVPYLKARGLVTGKCPGCTRTYTFRPKPRVERACATCCRQFAGGSFDPRFRLELLRDQ